MPRLPRTVPRQIDIVRRGSVLAEFAETFLGLGILQESDWRGGLGKSIESGLSRWVNTLGLWELRCLDVNFLFLDSLDQYGQSDEEWIMHFDGMQGTPVCGFMLEAVRYRDFFIEERVRLLESLCEGAGFSALGVAAQAIWRTTGAATPDWIYSDLVDEDDSEDEGGEQWLTQERYLDRVPIEACGYAWNRAAMEEGRAKARRDGDSVSEAILCDALELANLVETLLPPNEVGRRLAGVRQPFPTLDHSDIFQNRRQILPIGVRWSPADRAEEVIDRYHDLLLQTGEETFMVWLQGFQIADPPSVERAVDATVTAFRLIVAADRLIADLAGVRTPHGLRRLVDIFTNEESTNFTNDTNSDSCKFVEFVDQERNR